MYSIVATIAAAELDGGLHDPPPVRVLRHVRLHHPGASILSGACGHEKGAARHHSQDFFRLELLTGEAELDSVGVLEDFRAPSAR